MPEPVFHDAPARIGDERAIKLVEKELALLRAQHRADIAELREASEISRAELSALIAETRASVRASQAIANNARFTLTAFMFMAAALMAGFVYYDGLEEGRLRTEIAELQSRFGRLAGGQPDATAPALIVESADRYLAPPESGFARPQIRRAHIRRPPARQEAARDARPSEDEV